MNKHEFSRYVAENYGQTYVASKEWVDILIDALSNCVVNNQTVTLAKFGRFEHMYVPPKKGRNVWSGKSIDIPATTRIKYYPNNEIKYYVKANVPPPPPLQNRPKGTKRNNQNNGWTYAPSNKKEAHEIAVDGGADDTDVSLLETREEHMECTGGDIECTGGDMECTGGDV